ncbi:MAG: divalent-cation tolerance protein CutA [Azoarcus sp.]|nr:divalent-cation tolerance protein CutA [Azoarcus sp.]
MRAAHPYEIPKLVAIPIVCGLTNYFDWLTDSVTIPASPTPDAP